MNKERATGMENVNFIIESKGIITLISMQGFMSTGVVSKIHMRFRT